MIFALVLSSAGLYVYYRPAALGGSLAAQPVRIAAARADASSAFSPDHLAIRKSMIVGIARLGERVSALADDAQAERDALRAERAELMDRLRAHD